MSLIRKKSQTLIPVCCASILLELSESALLKGIAGTETLTRVRRGHGKRQRLSFILEEIILLKIEWIEAAQKPNRSVLRLVS